MYFSFIHQHSSTTTQPSPQLILHTAQYLPLWSPSPLLHLGHLQVQDDLLVYCPFMLIACTRLFFQPLAPVQIHPEWPKTYTRHSFPPRSSHSRFTRRVQGYLGECPARPRPNLRWLHVSSCACLYADARNLHRLLCKGTGNGALKQLSLSGGRRLLLSQSAVRGKQ